MEFLKRYQVAIVNFTLMTALYIIIGFLMPSDGFWCYDNGNKYILTRSIIDSNFTSAEIPWKGTEITENFTLNPIAPPFSYVKNGKIFSIYHPFFSTVTALPVKFSGPGGTIFIPLTAALAIAFGIFLIARELGLNKITSLITAWFSATATPLLFYSFTYWEHTLSIAFIIFSIYFLTVFTRTSRKIDLVYAGILGALAIASRDVNSIVIFSTFISLLWVSDKKQWKGIISSLSIGMVAILIIPLMNYLLCGDFFDNHLSHHMNQAANLLDHLKQRWQVAYNLLIISNESPLISTATFFTHIVFVILIRLKTGFQKYFIKTYLIFIITSSALTLYYFSSLKLSVFYSNGFISSAALLMISFSSTNSKPLPLKLLKITSLLYPAIYLLLAPLYASTGFHWGGRFLLPLYPILTLIAFNYLYHQMKKEDSRTLKIFTGIAIFLALSLQLNSLRMLHQQKSFSSKFNQTLSKLPEKNVLCLSTEYTHLLPLNFHQKRFFNITDKEQKKNLKSLTEELKNKKQKSLIFLANRESFKKITPHAVFDREDFMYFYCKFIRIKIK